MAPYDGRKQDPKPAEQIIVEGLHSFFANPRHFDHVVLSVKKSVAPLASKLERITDELATIDRQSEALEQTAGHALAQISQQKMPERVGAVILASAQERLQQLCRRRATLEVHEAWLGKEIASLEAFESDRPWCRLYLPKQQPRAQTDLRQLFVDSVVVYLRP